MFLVTVLLLIVIVLLRILWFNREHWQLRIYKHVKDIPGPLTVPFIGNILPYVGSLDVIWKNARNLAIEYDGFYKIWAGNRCAMFVSDPKYIEVLLTSTKNIEKSEPYSLLESWLGTGLLVSGGEKWKFRRKILTPAFHFHILKEFVNVFEEQSERSVQLIREECNKPKTNVIELAAEHALCALCETTMGIKMDNYDNTEFTKYKNAIYQFGQIFMDRIKNPLLYSDFMFNLTPMKRMTSKLFKTMKKFTLNVIDERLANWDDSQKNIMKSASGKQLLPMLDILISEMKNGADINYYGICEEVDTFMFEGHDTTSMGLSFLLMLLADNLHVQNKIHDEQNAIFNGSERTATYEDLQNMKYLEMVIKESLRLYPSVPIIGRKLVEDIQFGKYTIPTDVHVYVSIYDLHRNPKYWDDPDKFDPDRFLPENCVNRHPFAYIPFSAGSRNCIGQRFVMLEMKSFVSKIIREYVLEPVNDLSKVVMKIDLVIRPLNDDLCVKFRRR